MALDSHSERRILVVCTANQCRSPMAEALIRLRLAAEPDLAGRVSVQSAGTNAVDGYPATSTAVQAIAEIGGDLAGHRSQEITGALLREHDLVLVMTANHREALLTEFPWAADRVRLMSELIGERWDVADPVGLPIEDYRATRDRLGQLIDQGWPILVGQGLTTGRPSG